MLWTFEQAAAELIGVVTNTTAESWVESPATWLNPFDTPIVRLKLWVSQPALACLAWVTEADRQWDVCSSQVVPAKRGKVLPIQGLARTVRDVEIDLRDSQAFGGIVVALRLVIGAASSKQAPTSFGLAAVTTSAAKGHQ